MLLCLKIIIFRIFGVSLDTVRTIYIVKEKKLNAAIVSFISVFIWFTISRTALTIDSNSIFIPISYSFGYGAGIYIGISLSNKFITGNYSIQVITNESQMALILKKSGFELTSIDIMSDDYYMLFIEINRNKYNYLKKKINGIDKNAFIVSNESYAVQNGKI